MYETCEAPSFGAYSMRRSPNKMYVSVPVPVLGPGYRVNGCKLVPYIP